MKAFCPPIICAIVAPPIIIIMIIIEPPLRSSRWHQNVFSFLPEERIRISGWGELCPLKQSHGFSGAVKKTIHLVVCTVTESKTSVAFSEYVNKSYVESKTKIFINHELVNGDWISCSGNDYDVLWILNHSQTILNDLDIKVCWV